MNIPYRVPLNISSDGAALRLGIQTPQDISLGVDVGIYMVAGEHYTGIYEVTPRAYDAVILETSGKVMDDNVTVFKVPYHETRNQFDGKTAYIAEEASDGN